MISYLLQRLIRRGLARVADRTPRSDSRRAYSVANAMLAVASALALLVSASAPASAVCNVTNGSFVCYDPGTFSGTGGVGQVFDVFTNNGTLDSLLAFNWTGGPYAVTNNGTVGEFTFSANTGSPPVYLDGYRLNNNGTIQSWAKFETGNFLFVNSGTVGGLVSGGPGNILIQNNTGASLSGGVSTDAGDDTILNFGTIRGNVDLGSGSNGFVNYGGTLQGSLSSSGDTNIQNNPGGLMIGGITTGAGDDSVANNSATIRGDIDLGSGVNTLLNFAGLIESGSTLNVGAANWVTNAGAISPGGLDRVQTTTLTGNLTQPTGTGSYLVTLASATSADRIDVSGWADLHGTVVVNRTGDIGDTGSVAIMTAGGTMLNNLDGVTQLGQSGWQYALTNTTGSHATVFYRYDLANCCGQYVVATTSMVGDGVNWSTNLYEPDGFGGYVMSTLTTLPPVEDQLVLSWNRAAVSSFLSSVPLTAQQSAVANILANADATSPAVRALNNALLDGTPAMAQYLISTILSPETFVANLNSAWQANNGFVQAVHSCPTFGVNPGFIQEGQCYWAKFGGRHTDWERTARNVGGEDQGFTFSGGVQVALEDEWRLGFAGTYENATYRSTTGVHSDRDSFEGAAVVKNRWDTVSIAASAYAGYTWANTERAMFGQIGTAESDNNSWLVGSNVRISQLFELPSRWYVKPLVDFNATRITTEDFTEHGAIGANLAVQGDSTWVLSASPAIEIGTEVTSKGIVYRPYLRAGGTFFDDTTYEVTAAFVAAPGQFFTATSEFDDKFVDIAAGVDILTADGVDLKLTYDGRFSENSNELSLAAKAAIPF